LDTRHPPELCLRPRGGIITSTLINDALNVACEKATLGYRVTAHGLRHSFANWLKSAGVPIRDIQEALRHRDQRTTATYLHTSEGRRSVPSTCSHHGSDDLDQASPHSPELEQTAVPSRRA
jgi:integrase/recombinase XerD